MLLIPDVLAPLPEPNQKQKRDSMNRPVLRLQVKTDTVDRNRRSASALPIAQSTSMRNLRSTRVESGVYGRNELFVTLSLLFKEYHRFIIARTSIRKFHTALMIALPLVY